MFEVGEYEAPAPPIELVRPASEYQPARVYPVLVGVGRVIAVPPGV